MVSSNYGHKWHYFFRYVTCEKKMMPLKYGLVGNAATE